MGQGWKRAVTAAKLTRETVCPERGSKLGHSILCSIGIERARNFQAQLEKEHRARHDAESAPQAQANLRDS